MSSRSEMELICVGYFVKDPKGLWVKDPKKGHCLAAEGKASDPDKKQNCHECANWNAKVGCVLGYNLNLDALNPQVTLQVVEEQALMWAQAGRYDFAIARLERFLKAHPQDPEAYLALVRVYNSKGYTAPDKRRGVILYQRYLELKNASHAVGH